MNLEKTSRYLSYLLRHHPEKAGITLDEHGWADVHELIDGVNQDERYHLTLDLLNEIVRTDEKQRYSFNEDKTMIRANQGHSINVDVELQKKEPPEILYHGTAERFTASIEKEGILRETRQYVHLSKDAATAKKVGSRHGKPVVYEIHSGEMSRQGYDFFLSANGVWLTKRVPVGFFTRIEA